MWGPCLFVCKIVLLGPLTFGVGGWMDQRSSILCTDRPGLRLMSF